MRVIRTILHIARADLLERIRQSALLMILGLSMLAAYLFVPPADAGYVTLYLETYRGLYNSAWVGASVALSLTLFLPLFGFYLVKNSIQRDERSRVGQIIASTSVKKLHYLIGKAISNFAVLSAIVVVAIFIALMMQIVRGEARQVEILQLVSPFLFVTLPIMSVVAALGMLFESRKVLQGTIGNVVYFMLYIVFVICSGNMIAGTSVITADMVQELTAVKPAFSGSYGIGILVPEQPLELFEWEGVGWTGTVILEHLSLFLLSILVILLAALLFQGFQETQSIAISGNSTAGDKGDLEDDTELGAAISVPGLDPGTAGMRLRSADLTPVVKQYSFMNLVLAEWRLMMSGVSLGWYVIAAVLVVLCLALPLSISSSWMIGPISWIWPLALWASMGSREAQHQTQFLVVSSPRFVTRQLIAVWIAGFLLACLTGSGMLLRSLIEGSPGAWLNWLAAAVLIPSLALLLGTLTKTNRTFEVLYLLIWYLGPFNKMPYLDFMSEMSTGASQITGPGIGPGMLSLIYLFISAAFVLLAYGTRRRTAQTT